MLNNIWRYSHFALAVSSCLFVFLATVTGLILAFEPIQEKIQAFKVKGGEDVVLSQVIDSLKARYDEVLEIEVNANYFVKASVISMDKATDGDFYINPKTGEKLADIPAKGSFFEWVTNFHRSLFLKTWGRLFVGITSFILLLIVLSGFLLLIQRQKGIIQSFSKIIKEDFAQYYHIVLGRLMLLPIVIITLTGVYLSLLRFSLIPEGGGENIVFESKLTRTDERPLSEFDIFKKTQLKDIRKLEFPFSDDVEEFFILSLHHSELKINQKTGAVVSELEYPFVDLLSKWSFNLHTGSGSIFWSIILALASVNILFFMYSGGLISYRRITSKIKNKFKASDAEVVILVGSENGSTRHMGGVLQKELMRLGKEVFLDDLNHYQLYPQMKNLVILTSTYGDGDPPSDAIHFLKRFENVEILNPIQYAIVGFGSKAYPKFCQFAIDIDAKLAQHGSFQKITESLFINNKSYQHFKKWATDWGRKVDYKITLPAELKTGKEQLYPFQILDKDSYRDGFDETFVLTINPPKRLKFQSGDLLVVYPPGDNIERLYSIGKDEKGRIVLSIKKHEFGLCSTYLNNLNIHSWFNAGLRKNKDFHFPKAAPSVTLIANGTGIAPFLGMIHEQADIPIQLYWGGRTYTSYKLYEPFLDKGNNKALPRQFEYAFSKENSEERYVQDIVKKNEKKIAQQIKSGGVIMICGSVTMQNGVLELLDSILRERLQKGLDFYLAKEQILMDCY